MEYNVKYLIGYPGWDKETPVRLVIASTAIRIVTIYPKKEVVIKGKDILDISFENQSKRSGSSAATGALIGGVLTGGIGALAGAAIGAKAKNKSELTLLFNEDGRERIMVLQTKDKTNAIFNGIKDAIENSKDNPDAEPTKEELQTESEEPTTPGFKIFLTVCIILIVLVVFWLLKGCVDAWNSVAV